MIDLFWIIFIMMPIASVVIIWYAILDISEVSIEYRNEHNTISKISTSKIIFNNPVIIYDLIIIGGIAAANLLLINN